MEWINIEKLFESILVFTSISIGLFGTFLATIFTFKDKEPMKSIISSIKKNKSFKSFLITIVITSLLLVLLTVIYSSINVEAIKFKYLIYYYAGVIFTFALFFIYLLMITFFYISSIWIFMRDD